jgi:hypothetical protein
LKRDKKPVLTWFHNTITGDKLQAFLLDTETIEGKQFYVLKMTDHPRIVKMAVEALKKIKQPLTL